MIVVYYSPVMAARVFVTSYAVTVEFVRVVAADSSLTAALTVLTA